MSAGPAIMLAIGLGVALVVGVWAITRAVKKRNDDKKPENEKQDENKPSA